jgi:8-oxo-dGTP pyrophosphatase MutT (NUDIX family)
MLASLIVVRFGNPVLMLFNGWRRQWELPGGMRDPGETARQAAVRELAEETGIGSVDLISSRSPRLICGGRAAGSTRRSTGPICRSLRSWWSTTRRWRFCGGIRSHR